MEVAAIIAFVGVLIFVSHLFEKLFEKTKIPDVLFLILLGLLIGPIFKVVKIEDFGIVGPIFTTVALVVILFQGGTNFRLASLGRSLGGGFGLSFLSFLVTGLVVFLATYIVSDLDLISSLVLGTIVSGTSSVIVIPLVKELKMKEESQLILSLESALSDVFVIVVALGIFDAYVLGDFNPVLIFESFISSFILAFFIGLAGGILWSILLNKVRQIEDSIFTTPAFVLVVFGISELLGYSGAIAALSFGITLGNVQALRLPLLSKYTPLNPLSLSKREKSFFSEIVFIVKTFFFVYMGISISYRNLTVTSLAFFLVLLMFIVRALVVRVSLNKKVLAFDAILTAVIIPKGLAAAVLASIPSQIGMPYGETIQNITYSVILFSVIMTSLMVFLVEKTSVFKIYQGIFGKFAIESPGNTVHIEEGN